MRPWKTSALVIERIAHSELLLRIWELRGSLTEYDAAYAAVAEALGSQSLTCYARIARARGRRATVELLA